MKRHALALLFALALPAVAAASTQEEVTVTLDVPQQCIAIAGPAIVGTAVLDSSNLQPTSITFTNSTVTVNCNVAGSVLTLSHQDLEATVPTTNTSQFTNEILLGVRLGGNGLFGFNGKREGDTNTATWQSGLQVAGDPRPSTFVYGRYRHEQPLYITGWQSAPGRGLVSSGYTGSVTVTLVPDAP